MPQVLFAGTRTGLILSEASSFVKLQTHTQNRISRIRREVWCWEMLGAQDLRAGVHAATTPLQCSLPRWILLGYVTMRSSDLFIHSWRWMAACQYLRRMRIYLWDSWYSWSVSCLDPGALVRRIWSLRQPRSKLPTLPDRSRYSKLWFSNPGGIPVHDKSWYLARSRRVWLCIERHFRNRSGRNTTWGGGKDFNSRWGAKLIGAACWKGHLSWIQAIERLVTGAWPWLDSFLLDCGWQKVCFALPIQQHHTTWYSII